MIDELLAMLASNTSAPYWAGYAREAQRELAKLREQIKGLQDHLDQDGVGHGQLCMLCGQPINSLAGDPNQWPVMLGKPNGAGYSYPYHRGCVVDRIRQWFPMEQIKANQEDARRLEGQLVSALRRAAENYCALARRNSVGRISAIT